ncbi:GNAT family N-acetyltransferase [Iamia majanohamensis]|uniref:GNAT family N-acetyltransferase n=1 Tax=Iamia majanohamensis TaxID=467976 RepID=A0AAF0BV49_9ACTN|nr:GNAT family N-acetyltransferase [Iamia majanohamensis]WCO66698.1 GNAT family N-acetyltransferase [Iamia majanohamensis]
MQVRLADLDDVEGIRAIYNREVLEGTATFDLRPRSPEEQRAWLTDRDGAHAVVVAVEGATVLGFGSLSPYRPRPAYRTTVEDSVYVDPDQQGRGVGRAILEALVATATQHGFHLVIGRITGHNEASVALHHACGFETVGVEREVGRKFSRWLDVVVVQRLLGDPRPPAAGGGRRG